MLSYDASFWEKVRTEPMYNRYRKELEALYQEHCCVPPVLLPYSKYKLYFETGDRKTFEALYFSRRRQLSYALLMYLIYGNKEYRICLQDIVWAICDEFTWAVPAHVRCSEIAEEQLMSIDLFCSETGLFLCETLALTQERLDKRVRDRVKYEVNRRIIQNFLNTPSFHWETATNNWASACACQVAGAFLYLAPEHFGQIRSRIENAMQCFLSGFGDDGCCREGMSYWIYGFGHFAIYCELLSTIEPDAFGVFQNPKIKNIAQFYQKTILRGGAAVTFADAQPRALYDPGIFHLLKKIYGSDFQIAPEQYAMPLNRLGGVTRLTRAFLYYNPRDNEPEIHAGNAYFSDAQWFIRQNDHYSFAAKGGHNNEPHNHNDIGSFLICVNGKQVLCDYGVGLYSYEYFAPETRYQIFVNGSHGHSVPIINGHRQMFGEQYAARDVVCNGNQFRLDILGAYGMDGSLIRTFETGVKKIRITDAYKLEDQPLSVVERFVSFDQPLMQDGALIWKEFTLSYDADQLTHSLSAEEYTNNFYGKMPVYFIDLIVKQPKNKMEFIFDIQF